MRLLLTLSLLTLVLSPAWAVLDSDPDQIGFYFDLNADVIHFDAQANVPFFIYTILTNPTEPVVHGFEFGYELSYPEGMGSLIFQLHLEDGYPDPGPNTPVLGEIQKSLATPLVTTEATFLMTWQYMLLGDFLVEYFIVPTPFSGGAHPVYDTDEGAVPMYPVSGSFIAPVASVNGDTVVPTRASTFGALKALYR